MINSSGATKAETSSSKIGDSFTVKWLKKQLAIINGLNTQPFLQDSLKSLDAINKCLIG
jgi:hypothetical protein